MISSIVTGSVWHSRMYPTKHAFEYPVYFFALDLDRLRLLSQRLWFFSLNRWNILSLLEKSYLRIGNEPLRDKVEMLLAENGIDEKPVTIELVTQLRYFGWVFNPVSFFFCRDSQRKLTCVIADVNNTFGEGHAYILQKMNEVAPHRFEAHAIKVFHVSPFFDRKGEYRFEFEFEPGRVQIVLDYWENGKLLLASSWKGMRREFNARNTFSTLCQFPFGGWLTIMRIHVQAALLFFIKKLPLFKKPEPDHAMTLRRKH